MLYGMIYTDEWFFCYNWHELYPSNKLLFFRHILFSGEIHYSNIKPETSSYTIPCDADVWSGEREPAHMK